MSISRRGEDSHASASVHHLRSIGLVRPYQDIFVKAGHDFFEPVLAELRPASVWGIPQKEVGLTEYTLGEESLTFELSAPEAPDNFPEVWSFPIHEQVSPENLGCQ